MQVKQDLEFQPGFSVPKLFTNSHKFLGILGVRRFNIMSSINIQSQELKYMQI